MAGLFVDVVAVFRIAVAHCVSRRALAVLALAATLSLGAHRRVARQPGEPAASTGRQTHERAARRSPDQLLWK